MTSSKEVRWMLGNWNMPYAGGMDVILESSIARDCLRSAHAEWLSPWNGGL